MPITPGQGQSRDSTEWKERGIASALTINLRIFKMKFDDGRSVYQHFDLNSGSGINAQIGCIGSPLAFIQSVREEAVSRYRAHFVDIDKNAVSELVKRPEMQGDKCYVFHGDNKSFIRAIPSLIGKTERYQFAIGSVLIDPNGTDVPINDLAWLSRQCPKIDYVINWNSTAFKRSQGRKGSLAELIEAIDKKYWLIRRQITAHQWTVLIGRNVETGNYPSMGFHQLSSSLGIQIFKECNHTKNDLIMQNMPRDLFDEI